MTVRWICPQLLVIEHKGKQDINNHHNLSYDIYIHSLLPINADHIISTLCMFVRGQQMVSTLRLSLQSYHMIVVVLYPAMVMIRNQDKTSSNYQF